MAIGRFNSLAARKTAFYKKQRQATAESPRERRMNVERWLLLGCAAALTWAAAGCGAGPSNTKDPSVQVVEMPAAVPPAKPAPEVYWVKLDTTKGDILIEVTRKWSPYGADRFYELAQSGYYDDCRVFRVDQGFCIQAGIAAKPEVNAKWKDKPIPDDHFKSGDPNRQSNTRDYVAFAATGMPNSRTSQFFINAGDNSRLDSMGFTPFGMVLSGMATVDSFYGGYGDEPLRSSDRMEAEGNAYLDKAFPRLDTIKKATLLPKKPDLPKRSAG
jgi:peptidyl-prolyl cis-trans isomerase A (cyclophilin A)